LPEKDISGAGEKLKLRTKMIPPEIGEIKPDCKEMN
jgi:hypothetical protein